MKRNLAVLVATDGGREANDALAATVAFPWPASTEASGVVARGVPAVAELPAETFATIEDAWERVAAVARRRLAPRWPAASVAVVDKSAVEGILAQADTVRAHAIVVGCRGQGALGRFILGSVSRGVVRRADCAVLVVKAPLGSVRRFALGVDGSDNASRAAAFVAMLNFPMGGEVTLVGIVEPLRLPSLALVPGGVRRTLVAELKAVNAKRVRAARANLERAAVVLSRAGWTVRRVVREGAPLPGLLTAARRARADVLVVGARGTGGLARLLLGSVAEGILNRSPASVLVVR